jgi:hypothetical protein
LRRGFASEQTRTESSRTFWTGKLSFASLDYAVKKMRTKRDVFLAEMAAVGHAEMRSRLLGERLQGAVLNWHADIFELHDFLTLHIGI